MGCCTLQTWTKVIAILEIISSVILLILCIVSMVALTRVTSASSDVKTAGFVLLAVLMLVCIVSLGFGILLLQGANKRDLKKIRIWFVVTAILTLIQFIMIIVDLSTLQNWQGIPGLIFSIICLVVVYYFKKELQNNSAVSNGQYVA